VPLKSLRGKIVVLDFWATWCGPCGMSLPLVTDATSAFKDKGVVFYAVNEKEDAAAIRKFQADKNLTFPVLLDSDGTAGGLYKANAIPETVLIDKNGKIAAVHVGYDPNVKEKLTSQLTDLLAGKAISATPANPSAPPPATPAPSTP
jgi:peroxiredoxin